MKKTNVFLFALFILGIFFWNSCSSPSSTEKTGSPLSSGSASQSSGSSGTTTGTIQVTLKDKPLDNAKNIWITISQIRVHMASPDSFIVISNTEQDFDLLYLKTNPTAIAQTSLQAGHYNQIRMPVVSGKIVFSESGVDVEYPLDVPSDEIKIPVQFEIMNGGTTQIILDFDAEKSIHVTKKGKNDSYNLRPVINVDKVNIL